MSSTEKSYKWPSFKQTPNHLAVILDGNGRWAQKRGKARIQGHLEGKKAVKRLVRYCIQLGIPHLSIYAFSTENWKRDKTEVSFIVDLIFKALSSELNSLKENGVKIKFVNLPLSNALKNYQVKINEAEEKTQNNSVLTLQIFFNYGSKQHLLHTFNSFEERPIDIESFEKRLCKGVPFPDLLIRTGGNQRSRLSNFMLWELSYSELFFLDVLWPDFKEEHLEKVLKEYQEIIRNFGDAS